MPLVELYLPMSIVSIALPPPPSRRCKSRHPFPPTRSLKEKGMNDFIHRTDVQNRSQFDPSSSNVEAESHFTSPTQSLRNTKEY
ncbi:hypothetical protein GEMRC1_010099 [Eukaryota sp. GEM-RC1]